MKLTSKRTEGIQTYQGYFTEDGRFVHDGINIQLPTRRRAIVNVFLDETADEVTPQSDIALQKKERAAWLEEFWKLSSEASDEEMPDFPRFSLRRELNV